MKKLVVLLAIMALCLVAAPAMADSDSWIGGSLFSGGSLYGTTGDLYLYSNLHGDGGSNTLTGGTQTYLDADLFGTLSAYEGAGNVWGQTSTYTGAHEGSGHTSTYTYSIANASVQTIANASGYMNVASWADSWAWNY